MTLGNPLQTATWAIYNKKFVLIFTQVTGKPFYIVQKIPNSSLSMEHTRYKVTLGKVQVHRWVHIVTLPSRHPQ